MAFATQFVQIDVEVQSTGIALRNHIETRLRAHGEPLRWAVTSVDGTTAQVEAVVTVTSENTSTGTATDTSTGTATDTSPKRSPNQP